MMAEELQREPDELPSKAPVWVMAAMLALFWLIVGVAVGKVL